MDGAPAVPAAQIRVETKHCAPLAPLPSDASARAKALRPAAEAARAVACHPEVFGMPSAQARASLGISDAVELTFSRRSVRIGLGEDPKVADLAVAIGLSSPKMQLHADGSFEPMLRLVDAHGEVPTPWGVGQLQVHIAPASPAGEGDIAEIPEGSTVQWDLWVHVPESALSFEPDVHAAPAVVNALLAIAAEPTLLEKEPEVAHPLLHDLGDRYTLSSWWGSGKRGFIVRPQRTELRASDFADQMKLSSAEHTRISIHDAPPDRMASAGETDFVWQGLSLEVGLSEIEDGGFGLDGWRVDWIQVGPAPE